MQNSVVDIVFERALEAILMRVFHGKIGEDAEKREHIRIAVAYSGGLDSTVLLHLMHHYASHKPISLFAFHVHHGLNDSADTWQSYCESVCAKLEVPFESSRVQVNQYGKSGIEADARAKRYVALGEMCRKNGVSLLLTAHHQDDQVETILFHMMRGSGMVGLSGMTAISHAPDLLKDDIICLGRPLLQLSRASLSAWAEEKTLSFIEDDSNFDTKYIRNAIRHRLVPVISDIFPGFQDRLARMAEHIRSAQNLLNGLAEADFQVCRIKENALDLARVDMTDTARLDNLLCYWLSRNGIRIPSTAWFLQARKQMTDTRKDAQICLEIDGYVIRKYRTILFIEKDLMEWLPPENPFFLEWKGESSIWLESWNGWLEFEESETGFDVEWLKKNRLRIDAYRGNARLKLVNRPAKKLKILCQEAGIPLWKRRFLPLVFIGDELIYAGGVGQAVKFACDHGKCIRLRWKSLS